MTSPPSDCASEQSATFWGVARKDYFAHPVHGPLPALLIVLTVVTGVVDAVSILALGRVFVANMTGNVVFAAFALAGAPGFSLAASVVALAGFLIGAAVGGWLPALVNDHRGRLLMWTTAAETLLVAVATTIVVGSAQPYTTSTRLLVAGATALALGLQNAAVRRLAVPDFTTTVLTMTLTGLAADIRHARVAVVIRRLAAILSMFLGGLAAALLVLHDHVPIALAAAAGLLLAITVILVLVRRSPAAWRRLEARQP